MIPRTLSLPVRKTKTFFPVALMAVMVLVSLARPVPVRAAETRALVILDPIGIAETRALVTDLTAQGAHVEHVVPGRALIGRFDASALSSLAAERGILEVYERGTSPVPDASADPILAGVISAWSAMTSASAADGSEQGAGAIGPPLAGDAGEALLDDESGGIALSAPPGAQFLDTSEFLLGSTTVAVLFPESDGSIDANQEDWTAAEEADVTAEVMNGMAWWVARGAEIGHTLTFVYDFRYAIPQGYEPITRHSNDAPLWVGATMTALGYTAFGNHFSNVRDFINDERDTYGTDWATSMFVIDDTIDPDDHFAGGFFAFSYYGGPYLWMTYGNAGWGIDNLDLIAAHELGHQFYAFDEYASSGCTCNQQMGYLLGKNQNCDATCTTNIQECIMNGGIAPITANIVEFNTAKQVGLLDADNDSIPNILDTSPQTILDPFGADSTTDFTPTYTGSGAAIPKPNLNTNGPQHDITLNVVSLVEWRVDGGAWMPATPADGAFDDSLEAFNFTAGPLANGLHLLEARAIHSYGNRDTTPAIDTLFVQSSPVDVTPVGFSDQTPFSVSPNPTMGGFTLRFGVTADSPVSLSVFSVDGRRVIDLLSDAIRPAGRQEVFWDGRLRNGERAPAGVYFLQLEAPGRSESVRAVLMNP